MYVNKLTSNKEIVSKVSTSIQSASDIYINTLKPFQFATIDMKSGDSYSHHYANFLQSEPKMVSSKVLRLAQEANSLATSLPISLESSVFVRMDEERMDAVKALITGPTGGPYSAGEWLKEKLFHLLTFSRLLPFWCVFSCQLSSHSSFCILGYNGRRFSEVQSQSLCQVSFYG